MGAIFIKGAGGANLDSYIIKGFYMGRTSTTVTVFYGQTFTAQPVIERLEAFNGNGTETSDLFNDANISNINVGLDRVTFTKSSASAYNDWGGLLIMKASQ